MECVANVRYSYSINPSTLSAVGGFLLRLISPKENYSQNSNRKKIPLLSPQINCRSVRGFVRETCIVLYGQLTWCRRSGRWCVAVRFHGFLRRCVQISWGCSRGVLCFAKPQLRNPFFCGWAGRDNLSAMQGTNVKRGVRYPPSSRKEHEGGSFSRLPAKAKKVTLQYKKGDNRWERTFLVIKYQRVGDLVRFRCFSLWILKKLR